MGREDPVHWRLESGDLCRPTGCLRGHRCQHNVERIPRGRICSSELRLWPPGWSKRKYEAAILLANRRTRRVEINWYEARTQTQMASGLTLYRIQQASGTTGRPSRCGRGAGAHRRDQRAVFLSITAPRGHRCSSLLGASSGRDWRLKAPNNACT